MRALVADSLDVDRHYTAARDRTGGDQAKIQDQLDLIFRHEDPWRTPLQLDLAIAEQAACYRFGVARVDRGARRAGGSERQPAELQLGRRHGGALLDEVESEAPHLGVFLLVEDFETVDDGADRADHVVADSGTQKGREVEGIERDLRHRGSSIARRGSRTENGGAR